MPTLSVVAVRYTAGDQLKVRFPDGTVESVRIELFCCGTSESEWLALRRAVLEPGTWVEVEG